jgi:hypothetical protein
MNKKIITEKDLEQGIERLKQPILPLAKLAMLLYLTGPFTLMDEVLAELNEPLETGPGSYNEPGLMLKPYLPHLKKFELIKKPGSEQSTDISILNPENEPVELFEALDLIISHEIIKQELEQINSLLCGPCKCTICCTGPEKDSKKLFFELPLGSKELKFFDIPNIKTQESKQTSSLTEPPLIILDQPFYHNPRAIYHWKTGTSLVLPPDSCCPNLDLSSFGCKIYPDRPDTCRRPQIFSYLLENTTNNQLKPGASSYIARHKLLAIWDCPYVKELKELISSYGQYCELETIFKENKV